MGPMFRSSADLFAELNRMQSLLDQVFPASGSSIRSSTRAGFPVLNVGTTPTSIEVQAPRPDSTWTSSRSPWTAACW